MKTNRIEISVLQGICATLILIAYFLPWFRVSFMGFKGSTSLVEVIMQINNAVQDTSGIISVSSKYALYPLLLLLIPLFAFINTTWQWIWNSPRVAFYFNLIPLIICALFIAATVSLADFSRGNVDILQFAGIGFYITFFAAIVSTMAAWTAIGRRYYTRYKVYMWTITILAIISFVLMVMFNTDPHVGHLRSGMEKFKYISRNIITLFFYTHVLFVIYAWIVVVCVEDKQKNNSTDIDKPSNPVTSEPDKITISLSSENTCPQCHKPMAVDWNTCPYCGYNSKEEEKRKQEEENLRFAPPEYRKED